MELKDNKVTEEAKMAQEQNNTSQKKWKQLTEKERYKIEALFHRGLTPCEIGRELSRDRRTIEREIRRGLTVQRNSDLTERVVYLADVGQRKHHEAAANCTAPGKTDIAKKPPNVG